MSQEVSGLANGGGVAEVTGRFALHATGLGRAAVKGWLWSLLTIASTTLLSTLVFLVTSRALDPVDFGIVAFAVAIVALISAAMPMAFGDALVQRKDLTSRHLDSVFWLAVGAGVLAYLCLWLATTFLPDDGHSPGLATILLVLGTKLILDALATVPGSILARRMEFRAMALRSVLANAIGAVICLTLVFGGYPLWGLVMSQVAGSAVGMIVTVTIAKWLPSGRPHYSAIKDLTGFGLYSIGGKLLNEARIDQLLFGIMMGPAVLGLYYFARRLHQMLSDFTAGAFVGVSSVLFASLQSDSERRRVAFETASFAATSIGFPVFVGLIVLAPTAIPLVFGSQWAGSVILVQSWSVIGIMASLGVIQAAMIRNLGEPGWWFWYQALSQITGWLLIVGLAPFGADVVMIAFALRTCVLWPISLRKSASMLDLTFRRYMASFAAPGLASAVAAAGVLGLQYGSHLTDAWTLLAAQIALGLCLYSLALIALARHRLIAAVKLLRRKQGIAT